MKKLEYREFEGAELRFLEEESQEKKITGYAAVFNRYAEGLPFREKIAPGAFAKSIQEGADVRLLINHDGLPLARTKSKTLRLSEDSKGLFIEAAVDAEDPDVQRIMPKLKRKDLDQMSFGFYVTKDKWEHSETGPSTRTIMEVDLFDVSIVTYPAYPQTSVSMRSAQEVYDSFVAQMQTQAEATKIEQKQTFDARNRKLELEKRRIRL